MKLYDLETLDMAILYARRMADSRVPYSNQPSEDEVLNNPDVIRCMIFMEEVLQEVKDNGGAVGSRQSGKTTPEASPSNAPRQFQYREDKPISQVLKQYAEQTGANASIISAASVNEWLAANGYLTKTWIAAFGAEGWIPTEKGEAQGIIGAAAGDPGREYVRITFNRNAQEFLARNLERITREQQEKKNKIAESAEN